MSGLDRTSQMQRSREPTQAALIDGQWLESVCRTVRFEPGDVLRRKGQHYRDMYWLTEGRVNVDLETGAAPPIERSPGSPIGEVAFLSGRPATATVTARTAASALLIDDPTLARLAREQPILTAELLRHLAEVAEERTSSNLTFVSTPASYAKRPLIDVYLCRSQAMLESAQRLRYDVYCQELGRNSPYADHDKRVITDHLDETGHVFIAVEARETIGTLRGNVPSEGSVGVLEELYGMRKSPHYPAATAVCTKFIVRKSRRGGPAAMKLIAAMVRYGARRDMKECYIDCVPQLLPYYKALGFRVVGPRFFHRENGPSYPMMVDLVKHGSRLSRDLAAHEYLKLYVKAKVIKWLDGAWRSRIDGGAP